MEGARQFIETFNGLISEQGLRLTPHFLDLSASGVTGYNNLVSADSGIYGDVLADRRNMYGLREPQLDTTHEFLTHTTPTKLPDRHAECGLRPAHDPMGFRQVLGAPFALGKEVRACLPDGNWVYNSRSQYSRIPE